MYSDVCLISTLIDEPGVKLNIFLKPYSCNNVETEP